MIVRSYQNQDLPQMIDLWNEVIIDGIAFPQEDLLDAQSGEAYFASQTYTGVAAEGDRIYGLYILHPNNVGRCGHICNTSYAVSSAVRGQHIGEKLVIDSLKQGKAHGFTLMQFNAVVASNIHARHLYERLGFVEIGMVPHGFHMLDGQYESIYLYYHEL